MADSRHRVLAPHMPYILMVVRGANEVAVAAATQRRIAVREDERLHHGLYWSRGLEEYRAPDLTDPQWQRTFLATSATALPRVAAWLSETAAQGWYTRADGALLYFLTQDTHGERKRQHVLTAQEAADLEVEWQWIVENVEGCGLGSLSTFESDLVHNDEIALSTCRSVARSGCAGATICDTRVGPSV